MDFKECTEASKAWCLESGASFSVDLIDEGDRKILFKYSGEDEEENSNINFSVTVPLKSDPASKWVFIFFNQ